MVHNVSAEVKIKKMKKPCYSQQSQIKMQQNLQDILSSTLAEPLSLMAHPQNASSAKCQVLTVIYLQHLKYIENPFVHWVSVELVTRAAESSFTNLYTTVKYTKHIHTLNHWSKLKIVLFFHLCCNYIYV